MSGGSSSADQVLPLNHQRTGPRQYSLSIDGGRSTKCTRNATSPDWLMELIEPGSILSERPGLLLPESEGNPHSGPGMRGKRTKKITISGREWSISVPASRNAVF